MEQAFCECVFHVGITFCEIMNSLLSNSNQMSKFYFKLYELLTCLLLGIKGCLQIVIKKSRSLVNHIRIQWFNIWLQKNNHHFKVP